MNAFKYHITSPKSKNGDPNGVCWFNNEYHVFYQYHGVPDTCWAHVSSHDLAHWRHHEPALLPDRPYDRSGCFSGSAIVKDGELYAVYTGNVYPDVWGPKGRKKMGQCVAFSSDGEMFRKHEGNPVIAAHPPESTPGFRDPKVWNHEGRWYMVVGGGGDGKGHILLYRSDDMLRWEYMGLAAESNGTLGGMWECPDLFALGNSTLLVFSPVGLPQPDYRKPMVLVGDFDYGSLRFTRDSAFDLDYGYDIYAPQTMLDEQGRRILFAWLGTPMHTAKTDAITLPRVLELDNKKRLIQRPAPELRLLRESRSMHSDVQVAACGSWSTASPDVCLEIIAKIDVGAGGSRRFGLSLVSTDDPRKTTHLAYDMDRNDITYTSTHYTEPDKLVRSAPYVGRDGRLVLHMFLDITSIELFTCGYRVAMTNRLFGLSLPFDIRLFNEDPSCSLCVKSLEIWTLHSAFR